MERTDFLVIGGGIVGLATAYALLRTRPGAGVAVLEKEPAVGRHQSGRNSGVLHAGLHYRPGTARARLAVRGIREMVEFCRDHGVPHERCGKLVVAAGDAEVPRLRALLERGRANGLHGLEWLGPEALRETEPAVRGVAAVRVPDEGIVDFGRVCRVLAERIAALGGRVVTGARVRRLARTPQGWLAATAACDVTARVIVNCAGLHADRVARLAGERPDLRIVPFRGEYRALRPERAGLVRHLIYPVPDPALPFLGAHLTRRIGGGIEAGPTASLALAREGYARAAVHARDLAEALAFPGVWRFLRRHPGAAWTEWRRSIGRRALCAALRRLVPELRVEDLGERRAGVRAQAMRRDGRLIDDFVFVARPGALHVLNAPSPAATAALAIGEEIAAALGRLPG